ncbi:MAG TPA: putative ABC exporter domain-containing protein [Vicinamibacterales bacterium]|nr:putative ABC exporter domain-containing protein [Vicinamibacterales bacterium]HPW19734.1 putative ABC exporter domain-containing protein [Vicinamibacterales bacterium]
MLGAFLYLTACSVKNRTARRVRLLRKPRYAAGLVVGLLYMWFAFLRRAGGRAAADADAAQAALEAVAGPLQFAGSLLLLAAAAAAWVWPGAGQAFAFSRAEVQFLFPAPVTRRQLVHYELLRSQLAILFGSAIATLFMRGGARAGSWAFLSGLWVLLMVVRLHLAGVALRRTSLVQHGASGWARHWLPLAAVAGALAVFGAGIAGRWPALAGAATGGEVFRELQRLGSEGATGILLWPFRALVRLPLSASAADFWRALPPALAILAANYVWVLRSDAAFEEASAAHAEKRASDRRAPRAAVKGAAPTPFTLAAAGPPETAVLWKNLILVGRYASIRTLVRLVPIVLVLGIVAQGGGGGIAATAATACLAFAAFAVLMGTQMVRNDLRQDLPHLALLKTWPLRGAALLRGEALGPVVVITAVTWLLLLGAAILGGAPGEGAGAAATFARHRYSYLAAAAALAPSLILAQSVVQNALAVLFPAWVAGTGPRARGIDAMGQRLLVMAGMLVILLLSVLPGAVVAALVAAAAYRLTGAVPIVVPALVVSAVVAGECWLALEGLGRIFDRTDASAADAAG